MTPSRTDPTRGPRPTRPGPSEPTAPRRRLAPPPCRIAAALLLAAAACGDPRGATAATYVIPHWIEHDASVATDPYAFDSHLYLRYTPGLAGTGSGGGAVVDLHLYDNSAGSPLTILGTQVCHPCTYALGGASPRHLNLELAQIISARVGFAAPVYVGYAVIVVRGADPAGVTVEYDLVNSHADPYDLNVAALPPLRLRAEDPAFPGARVFSIPHMLETPGTSNDATYTFDETLFAVYTGGQAGTAGGAGATVSLYLYDETTATPLTNFGLPVCAPCGYSIGGGQPRKVAIRMDDLVLARGGGFDSPVKRAAGVVVVGGPDPGNVALQPWLINTHSGPFDLAMTPQTAQPVAGANLLAVLPDDHPGRLSAVRVSPNPAPGAMRVEFDLAAPGEVELAIFDVAGRQVATLERGTRAAGRHEARWDGRDAAGRRVEGGIYFARLTADDGSAFSRVVVIP